MIHRRESAFYPLITVVCLCSLLCCGVFFDNGFATNWSCRANGKSDICMVHVVTFIKEFLVIQNSRFDISPHKLYNVDEAYSLC